MKELRGESLRELSDKAAEIEARRLLTIIIARRHQMNRWLGIDAFEHIVYDENSGLAMGMLALFRYARGENVPAPLVQSFLDELLALMFTGLASGVMALPPFNRMQDRPWALAWRVAELRLAIEQKIHIESKQFAHLLGVSPIVVREGLQQRGISDTSHVPADVLQEWFQSIVDETATTQSDNVE
ncbi:MAG: hypothetical protein WC966_10575 [Bradymonadales bacterium]